MDMENARATARCWLEVDLDAVAANYDSARQICGADVEVIPVLKADAYGLGAARIARVLADRGAALFAVAEPGEALEVMAACGRPALVLGMVAPVQMEAAVAAGMVLTVYSLEMARALDAAAARVGKPARAHIKLDTGMHRLGLEAASEAALPGAVAEARAILALPRLRVEGLYTHLALRDRAADDGQAARLLAVAGALRASGADIGRVHAADSIGMVRYPEYRFDAVRVGAWLYGVVPGRYPNADGACRLPLRLVARVAQLHRVPAGACVGYDEDHPLRRDSLIATLSAGYADGVPRLNSVGEVVLRGRRAPVVGLTCMDQMTVDVTDVPGVRPGDAAALLGGGIPLEEAAEWAGTNRNDLLARIGRRVPRVYLGDAAASVPPDHDREWED